MIVKWNHRVEDKLLYRGHGPQVIVRVVSLSLSLSRAAVRMADISLTEALVVQFYCYRCSLALLPSDSGKKRWKWALAAICSHVSARENFGCSKFLVWFKFSWI